MNSISDLLGGISSNSHLGNNLLAELRETLGEMGDKGMAGKEPERPVEMPPELILPESSEIHFTVNTVV